MAYYRTGACNQRAKDRLSGNSRFFLGHIIADFLWYAFISILISKNKRISKKIYKIITSICAIALISFDISFTINHFTAAIIP